MGFIEAFVLILIILKLLGAISIGWLKCFIPFLLYPILWSIYLVGIVLIAWMVDIK
jgi:hypothetical protein